MAAEDATDAELRQALRQAAEVLDCGTAAIYLPRDDRPLLLEVARWCAPGFDAPAASLPVDALPDNDVLSEVADYGGCLAGVDVPIRLDGEVRGLARFHTTSARSLDARLLELVGHTLSLVCERRRSSVQLTEYAERLRSLARQLVAAEEQERRLLASDLHDGVGQLLAQSLLEISRLRHVDPDAASSKALGGIYEAIEAALDQVRSLMFALSPPVLHQLGLAAALDWLSEQVSERHGLECELAYDGLPVCLEDEARTFAFRAVQELLNNIRKHAGASRAGIELRRDGDWVVVAVEDDGRGMPSGDRSAPAPAGFGLFSIRERIRHLGGSVVVDSNPGSGTRVTVCLPVASPPSKPG